MKDQLMVALGQMNMVWENKEKNQAQCEALVQKAAKQHAHLIVFPEMTLTGFSMNVQTIAESASQNKTKQFFSTLAKKYNIAIVFGMVEKGAKKKGKNVLYMVSEKGKILTRYEKIHPFSYAGEDTFYTPGVHLRSVRYHGFKFSFLICYDLRFAGLVAAIARQRPDITVVIANWPKARIKHFQILLQARALDTQSFMIGVNRIGVGNAIQYSGGSQVYAPNGTKKLSANKKQLSFVSLSLKEKKEYAKAFPFLKDSHFHYAK